MGGASAVSTQAANVMTFQAPSRVKSQQSLWRPRSPSSSHRVCVSTSPHSPGPLITHLPDSMLQKPQEKHLTSLRQRPKTTFSGFLAAKRTTIKRSLSTLGGALEGTEDGDTYPVERQPQDGDGDFRLVGLRLPQPQIPAAPLPGKVLSSSVAAAHPMFTLPL